MATGGSAIVGSKLGAKNNDDANKTWSLIFYFSIGVGVILTVLGLLFIDKLLNMLGATPELFGYCKTYGIIFISIIPFAIGKIILEYFIRTDGKFMLSLALSIIGGIINIVFDYIFIVILGMGIAGAAIATAMGIAISALIGFIYFFTKHSTLKLVKPKMNVKALGEVMVNGSSEMLTELSTGITTYLFNLSALKFAGADGVVAVTIILYAHFLMMSTFLGFVTGVSPIISYNHGSKNSNKIKETMKHSSIFLGISSMLIFVIAELGAPYIINTFITVDNAAYPLTLEGMRLFSLGFLFMGINIFASGLFTSFSNGKISAMISLSRSLVFILIGLAILPQFLQFNGVWLTIPLAESVTLLLSWFFFKKYKRVYSY